MSKKRRANGEGSIYQRKGGLWCGVVTTGYEPNTGKQKRQYFYGKTKEEARKKVNEFVYKIDNRMYNDDSEMYLKEWLNTWLRDKSYTVATNTYEDYKRQAYNHIIPEIGDIRLKNLNRRVIQNLIREKHERGSLRGKGGLSANSVKHIYRTIRAALGQAVEDEILRKNPAIGVKLPKIESKRIKHYSREQVKKLYSAVKDDIFFYTVLKLTLSTGLRRGEVLGLSWDDIDFDNMIIYIRRQVTKTEEYGTTFKDGLKNLGSQRTVIVSKEVLNLLKRYKVNYYNPLYNNCQGNKFGANLIFIKRKDSEPINPDNFYKEYKKIIKKAGVPKLTFHQLRHTFATLHLEEGISMKMLQKLLGHSSIKTTMDIYTHITSKIDEDTREIMERVCRDIA